MKKKLLLTTVGVMLVTSIVIVSLTAPAYAVTKWRYQSMWAPSITLWRPDKYLGDMMNILAAGELELQYFPGGTLITRSDEIFDAVSKGTLEMSTDWPSYWEGKNTAFGLFTSFPSWFAPGDYMIWFWQAGGLELGQELYHKYGIHWFPHSVTGPESGHHSIRPVRTGADYKGLKIRQCGRIQAKILNDLGASAIFMPGAEVYLALSRGTVDAAEFSVPEVNWAMGVQEVTKYVEFPGFHQPGPVSGIIINKKAFDKLPDRVKFMFKEAAMATMMWSYTFFESSSSVYMKKFKEKGTEFSRIDQPTLDKVQELCHKYIAADAEANPDFAKVAFSQAKFLKDIDQWRTLQVPFSYGRTPKGLNELYLKLEATAKKHKVYDSVIDLEKTVQKRMEKQDFWKPGTPYVESPITPK